MNTSIQDGVALGHALAGALEAGHDGPLDQYELVRRPIATRLVAFTDRMTRMATLRHPPQRAVRNAAIGVVSRVPAFRRWLATELSGLRNR